MAEMDDQYMYTQAHTNLTYLFPDKSPRILTIIDPAPNSKPNGQFGTHAGRRIVVVSDTTGELLLEFTSAVLNDFLYHVEELLTASLASIRAGEGKAITTLEPYAVDVAALKAEVDALKVTVETVKKERAEEVEGLKREILGWKNEVEGWKREVEGWKRETEGLKRELQEKQTPLLYDEDESNAAWSADEGTPVGTSFSATETEESVDGCAPWLEVRDINV